MASSQQSAQQTVISDINGQNVQGDSGRAGGVGGVVGGVVGGGEGVEGKRGVFLNGVKICAKQLLHVNCKCDGKLGSHDPELIKLCKPEHRTFAQKFLSEERARMAVKNGHKPAGRVDQAAQSGIPAAFGAPGSSFGAQSGFQAAFGAQSGFPTAFGAQSGFPMPFGAQVPPFGVPVSPFGAPGSSFGAPGSSFGAPGSSFGAQPSVNPIAKPNYVAKQEKKKEDTVETVEELELRLAKAKEKEARVKEAKEAAEAARVKEAAEEANRVKAQFYTNLSTCEEFRVLMNTVAQLSEHNLVLTQQNVDLSNRVASLEGAMRQVYPVCEDEINLRLAAAAAAAAAASSE